MGIVRIMERGGDDLHDYKKALKMAKKGIDMLCELSEEMEDKYSTFGLLVNTTFGNVPFSGLLSTSDTVPSMCRHIHTRVPFAHSVVQRMPSTSNRPRGPTTEPFHSDQTSSHHPSCGGCRNLHWPALILSVQTFSGMS